MYQKKRKKFWQLTLHLRQEYWPNLLHEPPEMDGYWVTHLPQKRKSFKNNARKMLNACKQPFLLFRQLHFHPVKHKSYNLDF